MIALRGNPGMNSDILIGLKWALVKLMPIELDLYQFILDTFHFCYPRMARGIYTR